VNVGWLETKTSEAPHGLRKIESAIDEDSRCTRFDEQTIAIAAAAEGGEAHSLFGESLCRHFS
jgi:hypothetical protein